MKVKVTRKFRDKYTGELYKKGDLLTLTEGRYNEIMGAGNYVFKIADNEAVNANSSDTKKKETDSNNSEMPEDWFDIMSLRELKEYADKTYKMTFSRGTKKAEIIETLRRLEHGK